MELFFDNIFKKFLFTPKENNLFLIENPIQDINHNKQLFEFLFEHYELENLFIKNSSSLASFLHSKENSLIIDMGGNNTQIVTLHEGMIMKENLQNQRFGGESMTQEYYQFLLQSQEEKKNLELFNFSFMKKNNFGSLPPEIKKYAQMQIIRDVKENCFKVSSQKFNPNVKFNFADHTSYELPDK